jgi:Rps23 Pro-64 3,4-dihydroxylase Tpa1-like proline 4-hydroxylase
MSAQRQPDELPAGGTIINSVKLVERASVLRHDFLSAQPFPHVVIDNFLPCDLAERLLRDYPSPEKFKSETTKHEPRRKGKLRSIRETDFTPFMRLVLHEFNSPSFIQFLERLSGIGALMPDPDIDGALRHFGRGGRLGIHSDFNFHGGLNMHRRLNLILYLNKDWKPEYRGDFELWDAKASRCKKRIPPLFNRALIFIASDKSYHGFPKPLKCPSAITRKSIQFYYYTEQPPSEGFTAPHGTQFRWRPRDAFSPERWLFTLRTLAGRLRK